MTTDFAGTNDLAYGVAIQGDGKIVAVGGDGVGVTQGFDVARYNIDGSLDITFDGDGKVTTDFASGLDQAFGVVIQADARIVAAGRARVSGNDDFALARYNTDGSLDTTFAGGLATTDFAGSFDQALALAIQANGRIVAAGRVNNSGNYDFGLARYTCLRRTSRPMSIPICP